MNGKKDLQQFLQEQFKMLDRGIVATPNKREDLESFAKANQGSMDILLMQMAKKGSVLHSSLPLDGIHYEAIITSVIFWYSVMKSLIKLVDFAKDSMVRKITILFYEHAN